MRLRDESGQAMIITAFAATMLVGVLAFAVDVGMLFQSKRKLQIAADAGAVAGALDYLYNDSKTSASAAADNASSRNGFTNGTNGVVVTVNTPPADGPNAGTAGYVEVTVSEPIPSMFANLLGIASTNVKARSVAGTPTNGTACIWAMAPTGTGLQLQGAYNIQAPDCGVYINSTSSDGVSITGSGGTVNALFVDAVGSSVGHQTSPTAVTPNAAPRSDPWGNLVGPTPTNGGCTTTDSTTTTITGTVSGPGLGNAICYTNAVTINGATMGAGTYMFENGVTISGTVTVNGGTLDVYSGTFNQGNAILNMTAPTSGSFDGIALMQPPSNTNELQVQFGSGNQTLDGYIYAPGAEVYLQDNGGGIVATGVVANYIYDTSSTVRIPSYDVAHAGTTLNRLVTVVE